jgi:tRNA pseudouridine38-40 synthase
MAPRSVQLVLHYDGGGFHGWQRQATGRTVQGVLEESLARLCGEPTAALGSGRTDAGVHARGQAVGVRVAERWTPAALRRALNALLPDDVWVAAAHEMAPEFHARFSATARRYSYAIGLDEAAASPFRRRWEWGYRRPVEPALLHQSAAAVVGEHCFRAFAVQGTAPPHDTHRCDVREARWEVGDDRLTFHVEANRFLHHMVRFLVGTMLDVASGRRPPATMTELLAAPTNRGVSPPAPPHALVLERVSYPSHLYLPAA